MSEFGVKNDLKKESDNKKGFKDPAKKSHFT